MKINKCDLCDLVIDSDKDNGAVSFGVYDFCGICTKNIRRAVCLKCKGTGKIRIVDDDATDRQATCGENRTQYKTIECDRCK